MKKLILTLCVLASLFSGAVIEAAEKAKVIFISGKPSHGRLAHEHRAGNMLLAKALIESGLPVEGVVLKDVGYPKDESVLDDASTIVIFCTGHGGHVLNRKLKEFDMLMKKGKGGARARRGNPVSRNIAKAASRCSQSGAPGRQTISMERIGGLFASLDTRPAKGKGGRILSVAKMLNGECAD